MTAREATIEKIGTKEKQVHPQTQLKESTTTHQ
jgi:hypothetical protein